MTNVILQPAGANSENHFRDSIEKPIPLDRIKNYLDENERSKFSSISGINAYPTWGLQKGEDNGNIKRWDSIREGDYVIFTGTLTKIKGCYCLGTIFHKKHSVSLAKDLGRDIWTNEGPAWEYIYFLGNVRKINIPYSEITRLIGIQGFYRVNVVKPPRSDILIQGLNLEKLIGTTISSKKRIRQDSKKVDFVPIEIKKDIENKSNIYETENINPQKIDVLIKDEHNLDKAILSLQRKEQGLLRRYLFHNKTLGRCGICGFNFPVDLLIAAHIKKRAKCNDTEKLDYQNIVMPMCIFGCDKLYENGYIAVKDGYITILKESESLQVKSYLDRIKRKPCSKWNSKTKIYFDWHRNSFS